MKDDGRSQVVDANWEFAELTKQLSIVSLAHEAVVFCQPQFPQFVSL
jgi:hypothetical protein